MLTTETKNKINTARDILVGKIPDPKGQIDQITNALIYKFMDDQDRTAASLPGGKASFFVNEVAEFAWHKLFDKKLTNQDRANLYIEGLEKLSTSTHLPELFQKIFKEAYLPFRDAGTIAMFLDKINEFDYNHSEELGNAFEYLLSVMGSQGDAGQFRTPRHIIKFIVDIIKPEPHETVIDPACGTAGFLVEAYNYISTHSTLTQAQKQVLANNLTGVDIDPGMAKIARVNLYLHGFKTPKITEDDTLTNPALWGQKYDVILANPPFMTPKGGIKPHDKFVKANKAEVLFTDYISEHLRQEGRAGIVVPEGIIFQSATAYKTLRKKLVDYNYLLAVISLPSGVFQPYSGVKTSILILDRKRAKASDSVLFIKIANDGFDLSAQRRENTKNDIPEALRLIEELEKAIETNSPLEGWQPKADGVDFQIVTKAKLRESGDYNLSGDRYKVTTDYSNSKYPMVELGEVAEYINGFAFKPEDRDETGLPIIRIQNLTKTSNSINLTKRNDVPEKYIVQNGDLLISWSATIGFYFWDGGKAYLNQHIFKVEPNINLSKDYLFYLGDKITEEINLKTHGNTMTHITKGTFSSIKIPLPPLEVQQQIVAEISGYQKIIDGAKLIATNWKPRIDIDPSWEMVKLGDVCQFTQGIQIAQEDQIKEVKEGYKRYIYISDLLHDNKLIFVKDKFPEKEVSEKDLIMVNTGNTSGKIYWGKPGVLSNNVFKITANQNVNMKYLYSHLVSENFYYELSKHFKRGAQPHLGHKTIGEQILPLPSILIQNEIVERIESERALVDSTKQLIAIYEAKIKAVIAKVWADVEEPRIVIPEILQNITMDRINDLQDMQWRTKGIIDIRLLASQFNIDVKYMVMNSSEYAFTLIQDNEIKIQINNSNSEGRQNFSIAHEIAHCVEDKENVLIGVHRSQDTEHERKMDRLGAEILMPEKYVKEIIQKIIPTENNLEKIAKYFGSSKDGMRRRLRELGLFEE
jgi:type I restriction enzyme M protein